MPAMYRRVSLAIVLLFTTLGSPLFAQEGNFLLTHHIPKALGLDQTNFDMVYDQQGLLNVANRQGILRYDGHKWDVIYTPMAVFALAEGPDGTMYAAGEGDFGKVGYTPSGKLMYQSLRSEGELIPKAWFDVAVLNHRVYFLSLDEILMFDTEDPEAGLQKIVETTHYYRALFPKGDQMLATTEGTEVVHIRESGTTVESNGLLPDSVGKLALVSAHPHNGRSIVGTHEKLWIEEAGQIEAPFEALDSLLKDSWLLSAQWVQDTLIAVGTLNQGVLFLNPVQGTLVQHINYHTGLPDNEVMALIVDRDQGVWVAHEFGFSRVSPSLPIRSFAHYPGLEGNLLAVQRHHGNLYVATSLGVFYLKKVTNYRETVYYVRKRNRPIPTRTTEAPVQTVSQTTQPEPETEEEENVDAGTWFKNLFNREAREARQAEREVEKAERQAQRQVEREQQKEETAAFFDRIFKPNQEETEAAPEIQYERRIRRELQSVRYVFKKVQGVEAKCKQLVVFQDRLLIGSHSGVYEITNDSTAQLISNQPVLYLYPSAPQKKLVLSTLYDEVLVLELSGNVWTEDALNEKILEPVVHINEDEQYLWLVSPDRVMRLDWNDTTRGFSTYPLRNPNYEPIFAVNLEGSMHFVNGEGYHFYDAQRDSVVINETLQSTYGPPSEYFFAAPDRLWILAERKWHDLSSLEGDPPSLDYLLLFEEIQHLSLDEETGMLWITTPEEEMYQYDYRAPLYLSGIHELVLKGVWGKEDQWLPLQNFVISKENSFVSFEFTRPDFLGKLGIQYRYRLDGLNAEWSTWSQENTITFNFLPPGDYNLEVQARDAFGNTNDPYTVAFGVVPPWWERGWFYLLEVGIFGSLLILSFRINRTKIRQTVMSRVLTYLTLIMIIEFLQNLTKTQLTLGGNPIVEFVIEAGIAFALLPIEGLLRKFMRMSSDAKAEPTS